MGEDAAVGLGQILRVDHGKFFSGEMAGAGVIVAGDHGRASYDAALPTRMVVQAIGFPSIFYNVSLL